ncbi:MAG: hypothetical protein ABR927_15540 [Bacteroidales bacterium]|jgi:uncharacterized membrane protein
MDKIIIKEYEWGKITRIRILVGSVICLIIAIYLITTEEKTFVKICYLIMAVAVIIILVQYFYMLRNKIFIQVANDEIKISPIIGNLEFSPKVVEWKDISEIKKNRSQITLIRRGEGNIKIKLVFLNKDDRDNLAQIIQEYIDKNKPTT